MTPSLRSVVVCLSSVALLAACGPSESPAPDAAADVAADVAPDVTSDVSTDVAPDAAIDAAPDVASDAAADVAPDVAPDAASDVALDAPADVAPDSTPDAPADVTPDVPSMDAPADAQPDAAADGGVGATCGTRGAPPCGDGLFCNYPIAAMCGAADAPGRCESVPRGCTAVYDPVCGCDGHTYGNACAAAAASMSVARAGACPDGGVTPDASTTCAAQDARGVGACDRFLGYAWNGSSCVGVSGCTCEGAACGSLFTSADACRAAYPTCDCRTTGCPATSTCMPCRGPAGAVYACIPRGAAC